MLTFESNLLGTPNSYAALPWLSSPLHLAVPTPNVVDVVPPIVLVDVVALQPNKKVEVL